MDRAQIVARLARLNGYLSDVDEAALVSRCQAAIAASPQAVPEDVAAESGLLSPAQVSQIRQQLSFVLEAVMCQTLLPRANGPGRALALEIMVPNSAIRALMRDDKIHQIYSSMQMGQGKSGMQTMNQSLAQLVTRRLVDPETAKGRSPDIEELQQLVAKGPDAASAAGGRRRGPA